MLVLKGANTFVNNAGQNNLLCTGGLLLSGNSSGFGTVSSGSPGLVYATNNNASVGALDGINMQNVTAVIAGGGAGGTNGAFYSNVGTDHGQYGAVYWCYGMTSVATPAIQLAGDATVRIDGDGISFVLCGAIGNVQGGEYNVLTKTGASELRIDAASADIQAAVIHVAQGILGLNGQGNGNLQGAQLVTIDSGARVACHRNKNCNSSTTVFVDNGAFDLLAASGTFSQEIGLLTGSGYLTNTATSGLQTLYLEGENTNGVITDDVFNGSIVGGPFNIVWENSGGTFTLNGNSTNNAFAHTVLATAGNLVVNGTNGSSINFAVSSGGSLSGIGSISGVIGLTNGSSLNVTGGKINTASIVDDGNGTIQVTSAQLLAAGQIGSSGQSFGTLNLNNGKLMVGFPLANTPAAYVNSFNVSGSDVLTFSMSAPSVGQFTLIQYGSMSGSFGSLSLSVPSGYTATLVNNTANSSIDVKITSAPANNTTPGPRFWTGAAGGTWDTVTANWVKTNGAVAQYSDLNSVLFNDAYGTNGNNAITIPSAVAPVAITVSNNAQSYSFSGASINGSSGLTKDGAGTLTINNANGYGGNTLVKNGTLEFGNAGAFGIISSSDFTIVSNGATVVIDTGLAMSSANTLVLSGTGTGGTNGALYSNQGTAGSLYGVTYYGWQNLTTSADPAVSLGGDATIRIDGGPGFSANCTLLIGFIEGNGYSLTKTGTGELRVDPSGGGGSPSIDSPNIHVAAGVLGLNGSDNISASQLVTVDSGADLAAHRNGSLNSATAVVVDNGQFDLQANGDYNFSQTIGSLSGNGVITTSQAVSGTQTLNIMGQDTGGNITASTFNGSIVSATNTAGINLVASGSTVVLHLNGTNYFTGTVTAKGGTVYANGWNSLGAEFAADVDNSSIPGSLGGTGVISDTVTLVASGTLLGVGDPIGAGGVLIVSNVVDDTDGGMVGVTNGTLDVTGSLGSSSSYVGTVELSGGTLSVPLPGGANAGGYATTFNVEGASRLAFTATNPTVGQFPLIAYNTLGGTAGFAGLSLSVPLGVTAHLANNTANSSIDVVITAVAPPVNTNPTNIVASVSGNTLKLSWPADHLGWTLQTNSAGLNATNQWFPYPGSASVTNVNIPINPGQAKVFFRMTYP
jgi:autotransporter-associated beta strand protein